MSQISFLRNTFCIILFFFSVGLLSLKAHNGEGDNHYVSLDPELSNIAEIISLIGDLDEDKTPSLYVLRQHVEHNSLYVDYETALAGLSCAMQVLEEKKDQFDVSKLEEITDNLCGIIDLVTNNKLDIVSQEKGLRKHSLCELLINRNVVVLGKTILSKHLHALEGAHIQGRLKVNKSAKFKKNVAIKGDLSVANLVVLSCIDNICINNLSATNASIQNLTLEDDPLVISSLSVVDQTVSGTLSVNDQVVNGSLEISSLTPAGVVHNSATGELSSSLIINSDITPATITNASLATISSSNVAGDIVVRDSLGNFETTMITIDGITTNPTDVATKAYVDAAIIPATGTSLNIPNTLVKRDDTGSFAAQTISISDIIISGDITLDNSTSSTIGNIIKDGLSFIHNYGSNNTFVGINAGNFSTSGTGNSAFGTNALIGISTGSNNTAIGYQSGQSLTTGNGNVYINANASTGAESATIRIGNSQTRCFIAGITGIGVSGDGVTIGSNGQLGITLSSQRFKHNIQSMNANSEKIFNLSPVIFVYNDDETETQQYGLIAEEVEEVFPELVTKDENGLPYTVRYHLLPVLLLNEIQKQQKYIAEQQALIDEMKERYITREEVEHMLANLKTEILF